MPSGGGGEMKRAISYAIIISLGIAVVVAAVGSALNQ
jgi:hypothetical protein